MQKIKEPVRLRMRRTTDGGQSLYLDIYSNGRRHYEYLHLYLVPEQTRKDKEKNKDTLSFAETIRAKRVVELRNGIYGFKNKREKVPFFAYFARLMDKYKGKGTYGSYRACMEHLRAYEKKDISLSDITPEWLRGFERYIERLSISNNTKVIYLSKVFACLHSALREGIITDDPTRGVERFKMQERERSFLTLEELRRLVAVPIRNNTLKRAFLFSCLTGLRWSDIKSLTWAEVQEQKGYTRIVFSQKKTKGLEYLDLNAQAVALMGERSEGKVFGGMSANHSANECLARWMKRAGIDKHITFHCARHTFAVMMLDIGTDIYTVSKLLGHRELSTTQIYAKVLDKNKRKAVEKIPSIM